MKSLAAALSLISLAAFAEAPLATSVADVRSTSDVGVIASMSEVGATASFAHADHADAIELAYGYHDAYLGLRGARAFRLTGERLFNLSAQVGAEALTTTRGPLQLGLGPLASINGGIGRRVQLVLSLQAGVEAFVSVANPVRVPTRVALGLQADVWRLRAALWARGGADLSPGLFPTGRFDALLMLTWLR